MRRGLIGVLLAVTLAVAGCGNKARPVVCNVRPSADGQRLIYSPPGCEKHLAGKTLNIETTP